MYNLFGAILAGQKNRSSLGWFLIGLFFNFFGLLVIAFDKLEIKKESSSSREKIKTSEEKIFNFSFEVIAKSETLTQINCSYKMHLH